MNSELIKAVTQIGIITADDVKRLTATELLVVLIEKLNEMVLHINDLDVVNDLFEKGVYDECVAILNEMALDGRLQALVEEAITGNIIVVPSMTVAQINDKIKNGGTILIKSGDYYLTSSESIEVKDNSHVIFEDGAVLRQQTVNATHYEMIDLRHVKNITLERPVCIGERPLHEGTDGEWGHGIAVHDCKNVTILDARVEETWGDGIYIGLPYNESYQYKNDNIKIIRPIIKHCSRNGISVTSSLDVLIDSPYIYKVDRTAPQSGIDIEPEYSSPSGVFLGRVRLTGQAIIDDCNYGVVAHLGELVDSDVDIVIEQLEVIHAMGGLHINSWNETNKGVISVEELICKHPHYSQLYIHNKGLNLPLRINQMVVLDRADGIEAGTNGEYGSAVWLKKDNEISYEVGGVVINHLEIGAGYGVEVYAQGECKDVRIKDLIIPPFNSYHNPVNTWDGDIIIDKMPVRDVTYGTPNYLKSDTYCHEMVYSKDIVMDQNYTLTIGSKLPDGDYTIRTLADNQETYFIQINLESGLTPIGFSNNIQLGTKTGYVILRKQGDTLILLEAYKTTGVN
jgi:hypothetical protein|nr:MAG TPA: K5 LYASE [Caudoviricetes sp.]